MVVEENRERVKQIVEIMIVNSDKIGALYVASDGSLRKVIRLRPNDMVTSIEMTDITITDIHVMPDLTLSWSGHGGMPTRTNKLVFPNDFSR